MNFGDCFGGTTTEFSSRDDCSTGDSLCKLGGGLGAGFNDCNSCGDAGLVGGCAECGLGAGQCASDTRPSAGNLLGGRAGYKRGCGYGLKGKVHPYAGKIPHTAQSGLGNTVPTYAYPYYTTRGPRDFLMEKPPTIGR